MENKEWYRLDYLPTTPGPKANIILSEHHAYSKITTAIKEDAYIGVGQYTIRKGANPIHYAATDKTARWAQVEARKTYDGAPWPYQG